MKHFFHTVETIVLKLNVLLSPSALNEKSNNYYFQSLLELICSFFDAMAFQKKNMENYILQVLFRVYLLSATCTIGYITIMP